MDLQKHLNENYHEHEGNCYRNYFEKYTTQTQWSDLADYLI